MTHGNTLKWTCNIAILVISSLILVGCGPNIKELCDKFTSTINENNIVLVCDDEERHCIYYMEDSKLKCYDVLTSQVTSFEEIEDGIFFSYGVDVIVDGDGIVMYGDNGGLGMFSGVNAVRHNTYSKKNKHLCFARYMTREGSLLEATQSRLVKEGDCAANNEYEYFTIYYDFDGHEITPPLYVGTIGGYPIVMELIDIGDDEIVGSYYYKKQGPSNRMYVKGTKSGRNLTLWGFTSSSRDTKLIETISGFTTGSEIEGQWRSNLDNRNLSFSVIKQ